MDERELDTNNEHETIIFSYIQDDVDTVIKGVA